MISTNVSPIDGKNPLQSKLMTKSLKHQEVRILKNLNSKNPNAPERKQFPKMTILPSPNKTPNALTTSKKKVI